MKIHQNDLEDILTYLPDLEEFDYHSADFIICTLGFEERTYSIPGNIFNSDPTKLKNIILVTYPTNKEDNNINRPHFENLKCLNLIEIEYEKTTFYEKLKSLLADYDVENKSVLFDISTCSSYLFYPIFKCLIEINVQLSVAYTEAEFYDPSYEEWKVVAEKAAKENQLFVKSWDEANFQSIDVDDVYSSNLFSEMNSGNKPAILVAIPNFNSIRMQAIREKDREINKTDSINTQWLIGLPPGDTNKWRADALIKTNALEAISQNNIVHISTLHYKETLEQLEAIWVSKKYDCHISIGTLGSKMQHLATFIFIYLHPDTGLWLAEPHEFKAKSYSKGIGRTYCLNFKSTEELKGHLSKYMHYDYEL